MNTATRTGKRSALMWLTPILAVAALALGIWSAYRGTSQPGPSPSPPATESATVIPHPRPLKPFSLTDHRGHAFSPAELRGHWTFMTFGYTSCPDICPTTLAMLDRTAALLDKANPDYKPQFVFVSVDPERDSLDHLAAYLHYYNARFLGATGPQAALRQLTDQFGLPYRRVESDNSALGYVVDHSAAVLLFGPQGRLRALFSAPHDPRAMAKDFQLIRKAYPER